MRARLLDMGEVGALRSESLSRALAEAAREPLVLFLRPASAFLSVGRTAGPVEAAGALPVVPRDGGGPAWRIDDSQLLFQVVVPAVDGAPELPEDRAACLEAFAAPVLEACAALGVEAELRADGELRLAGLSLGGVALIEMERARGVRGHLRFDAAAGEGDATGLAREIDPPPRLADIAESLLAAFETALRLEPVPSMPTPAELDAIWSWDARLASGSPAAEAAPDHSDSRRAP